MKRSITFSGAVAVAIALLLPAAARAQKQVTKKAPPSSLIMLTQEETPVSLTVVSLPDGAPLLGSQGGWTLDLGGVSYAGIPATPNVAIERSSGSFVVSTEFGLMIRDPRQHSRTVSLLVFLDPVQSRVAIRIDGVTLQAAPQLLATHIPTSVVTRHRLEIEIPASLAEDEKSVVNGIEFSVVPD